MRSYTTAKALLTTQKIKLINKEKFAKAALDENIKTFVVHISFLSLKFKIIIYSARKVHIVLLLAKKVTITTKYLDFVDVFLGKSANVLLEQIRAKKHAIELEQGKQPPYRAIYNLGPIEFKTLKTYIKNNLANGLIKVSKSPIKALILFICKLNNSLYLCVDYQRLNNLMIKNWNPSLLIGEFVDWLG